MKFCFVTKLQNNMVRYIYGLPNPKLINISDGRTDIFILTMNSFYKLDHIQHERFPFIQCFKSGNHFFYTKEQLHNKTLILMLKHNKTNGDFANTHSQYSSLGVVFLSAAIIVVPFSTTPYWEAFPEAPVIFNRVLLNVSERWLLKVHAGVFHGLSQVLHGRTREKDWKR